MTNERTKQEGFVAATRRFPRFELAIKRLLETDENFRDICEELAEAEVALSAIQTAPEVTRSARQAEWQELILRLAGEVETALRSDNATRGTR
jgi:hypothetical protein